MPLRSSTTGAVDSHPPAIDPALAERVRSEFREMRGFSPTMTQAARLFHLPHAQCARVIEILMQEGFLHRLPDGTYRLAE